MTGVLLIMMSCAKQEVTATFTTPSIYRFNSPTVVTKTYYAYENGRYNQKTKDIESFITGNEILADSINNIFDQNFSKQAFLEFNFLNSNQVDVTLGKLDSTKQKYITGEIVTSNYRFEGNFLKIDSFPSLKIGVNNFFLELRECYHFADRLFKRYSPDTFAIRNFNHLPCRYDNDSLYINSMKNDYINLTLDTVAIYNVELIYSKY
jgi:hypothetical protein